MLQPKGEANVNFAAALVALQRIRYWPGETRDVQTMVSEAERERGRVSENANQAVSILGCAARRPGRSFASSVGAV